jgi:hypothetical protein
MSLYIKYFGMLLMFCKQYFKGYFTILQCQTVHTYTRAHTHTHTHVRTYVWRFLCEKLSYFYNTTIKERIYDQHILLCWYQEPLIRLYAWRVGLHIVGQHINKRVMTRLIAREDFIEFSCRESYRSYTYMWSYVCSCAFKKAAAMITCSFPVL